jgi:hypothetical protein
MILNDYFQIRLDLQHPYSCSQKLSWYLRPVMIHRLAEMETNCCYWWAENGFKPLPAASLVIRMAMMCLWCKRKLLRCSRAFWFQWNVFDSIHGRMVKGGLGITKVSPGPAMPYPSMPCGQATSETALWLSQEWPAHRAGSLRLSSTPLDTPRRRPVVLFIFMYFAYKKYFTWAYKMYIMWKVCISLSLAYASVLPGFALDTRQWIVGSGFRYLPYNILTKQILYILGRSSSKHQGCKERVKRRRDLVCSSSSYSIYKL